MFSEIRPCWQFQSLQVHFFSNLVESLASPTKVSMHNFHPKGKHKGFGIAIIERRKGWCNERKFSSILINFASIYHHHHSLHQNLRTGTCKQLMTRSNIYFSIRKCELPPCFCTAIYMLSVASKQCPKFHRFSNCLAIFKLMGFAKRHWWSQYYCTDIRNGKHGNL